MKAILLALLLAGCAQTRIDTRTSKGVTTHVRFQGDMKNTTYTVSPDGAVTWRSDSVNHSVATTVGGKAISAGATAFGSAATGFATATLLHIK